MDHADLIPDLPLEVRVHGRGGQGGVTCAKLIAGLFSQLGLHVQTFGDYGSERAGAPVQAYARIDRAPIRNANKVYRPGHLLVLDEALLGPHILEGVEPGALLLLNTPQPLAHFAGRFDRYRFAVLDATAIAREHGIGSASVVIINTTILGAYARILGLPLKVLDEAYAHLGLASDLPAAEAAFATVEIAEPRETAPAAPTPHAAPPPVMPILQHRADTPASLKTGNWSSQIPAYVESPAPCNHACPAGNDVVGFVQALAKGDSAKAAALLFETQPLPSVCGRVCPAPCMNACNRAAFDGAVNIRSLERLVGDSATATPTREDVLHPQHIAVVGGGPAGLSAAYQLARAGHLATIYEAGPQLGGVLATGIPAFRLPPEMLQRDLERILALGIKARLSTPIRKADLATLTKDHDGVVVAVGFGASKSLGIAGENLGNVEQGLAFLARVKEMPEILSGTVIVVGGGNTAIDCARTALRCGADKVKLVYRRAKKDMPAIAEEIAEAEREGVMVMAHRQPIAIHERGALADVVLAEMEAGPADASGRRRPVVTARTATLTASKILLALGQGNEHDLLPAGWSLRGARAYHGEQALPVYFAGDCAEGEGTVTHAIGSGRKAAAAILTRTHAVVLAKDVALPVAPGQIRFDAFPVAAPHADRLIHPAAFAGDFSETNLGLADAAEASRCFSCGHCTLCDTCLISCPEGVIAQRGGHYRVDPEYCKGCGMCVAECPRAGIEMQEKRV
ncbi:MAG: 2-oxoacid:acceptor oxidoreductase family protein [Rhizomicrobium sp.]|nr:2-oxoacid:acceptor oxidoreductase family protein [Rhizomicrobium sp.]